MSNEEIVERIRSGDESLIPQLWEQVERFISMQARHYLRAVEERGAAPTFEVDDLVQEAYFAMLQAVDYYDAERGDFLRILELCCKTAFAEVAGYRRSGQRSDALPRSISGDALLAEDGDLTLMDTIPADGPTVEDAATAAIYQQQLHDALDHALAGLTTRQETILRRRYYQGETQEAIATDLDCTRANVSDQERAALHHLYDARALNGLGEFLKMHTNYYAHTGMSHFKHTGTSAVETIAIKREELARKWLNSRRKGGKGP